MERFAVGRTGMLCKVKVTKLIFIQTSSDLLVAVSKIKETTSVYKD